MSKTPKIIIGLAGEIAAGKDTVAAYLKKKYGSQTVSFSQPLREILDILLIPQTRANLAWLGESLRKRFGQDILAKAITKQTTDSTAKIVCLPNVRLPQDIKYLKKISGFYLVGISAEPKIRFARLKKRRQNTDDKTKTWARFLKDALLPTEIKIRQIKKQAKYQLDNNGDLKKLYRQVDEMIKQLS